MDDSTRQAAPRLSAAQLGYPQLGRNGTPGPAVPPPPAASSPAAPPLVGLFRQFLCAADETAAQVTDAEISENLRRLLGTARSPGSRAQRGWWPRTWQDKRDAAIALLFILLSLLAALACWWLITRVRGGAM